MLIFKMLIFKCLICNLKKEVATFFATCKVGFLIGLENTVEEIVNVVKYNYLRIKVL